MEALKQLLEVSAYEPGLGYSYDLKQLVEAGLERSEALRRWVAFGRSEGSFYKAYKVLKDDLVRLAFWDKKGRASDGRRLDVLEKHKVVGQLLIAGKKTAAVALAIELVTAAQREGFTEVVVGLSSTLEEHFGGIEVDTRRYLRYRKIRKDFSRMLEDELEVKGLQARLVFYIERKKDLKELEKEIGDLIKKKTGSFTYMRYRFSVLSIWYDIKGTIDGLITAFRETLDVYETCGVELPGAALTNLYFRLSPILVGAGRYGEAEAHISKGLKAVRLGSQNWHLLMLQRACLGHLSGKPGMARAALKMALEAPREHENPDIDRRWALVASILDGQPVADVWKAVLG